MAEYLQADILSAGVVKEVDVDVGVVVHKSIDSTNNWSLQQCKSGRALPFACFAEEQTSGRGRRGKQWLMPAYSNVAMSMAWPFALSHQLLQLLPLSIAMAVVSALESIGLQDVQIKWPNDVYVQGAKIAGILIETQPIKEDQVELGYNDAINADEGRIAVVIGVGLNYDMSALGVAESQDLPVFTDIFSALESQLQKSQSMESKPGRNKVALTLLQHVIEVCKNFQQNPVYYLEHYRAHYDYCKGKNVRVTLDNGDVLTGVAQGVNDNAELLVLIEGKERAFNSAEVSVKAGPTSS